MNLWFKKVISSILAVALIVSMMVVPAGATDDSGFVYHEQPTMYSLLASAFSKWVAEKTGVDGWELGTDLTLPITDRCTREQLEYVRDYYNDWVTSVLREIVSGGGLLGVLTRPHAVIAEDADNGIYRLADEETGEWIVDKNGGYPWAYIEGDSADQIGANTAAPPSQSRNKFIEVKNLDLENIQLVVLTEDALAESVQLINDDGLTCTMSKASINGTWYWVIMRSGGTSAAYYCNSAGQPYVALYQPSATNNQYDYIVGDNAVIEDSQIIDLENGTLNLIDDSGNKIVLDIESMTFDTGNKNYTVNAYTTVNEGDTYYYTYYTYNITYNIKNTYITYIGSNDAYEKEEYEYYYQLPDGRSSADLTADEVAGMSFEFHDVVNYAKSATDVSVRALYHFDGDIDDSSYFSTQGKFEWTENASITYMEAPSAFDGTLYLDQDAHAFDVILPSNLTGRDFSIQFRHYQASEPDTQNNKENSLSVGSTTLLSWDESYLYYGSTSIADLPIGTWAEIAVVRNSGILYIYVNGLCVHSVACDVTLSNLMHFAFGDSSRAYTMLDELRVLNFALAEGGTSYTPATVPYDSNLVLVLPDSDRPMADEYTVAVSSHENLLGDTHNYLNGASDDYFDSLGDNSGFYAYSYANPLEYSFPYFSYRPDLYSLSVEQSSLFLTRHSDHSQFKDVWLTTWGFGVPIGPESIGSGLRQNTDYTFSIVREDGSVCSLTFNTGNRFFLKTGYFNGGGGLSAFEVATATFDWGYLYYCMVARHEHDGNGYTVTPMVSIAPKKGQTVDVAYIELVEGTETDIRLETRLAVYDGDTIQPNTAAVQSDIPVNGYTVGGVRPTLPARGDVWFPVSENRIQTCYIYTGTMWEEVGCRWYTGSRWIPIYAFDLVTLEDLFDIADADGVVTPITSQSAFWRWWQLQWLDFRKYLDGKFDELIAAITGKPVGSDTDITVPDEEGNSKFSFSDLLGAVVSSVLEIATSVLTEFIGLIADLIKMFIQAVMDFIGGFVGVLSDAAGHITTLGDSVAPIGDFVRGIYDAIPDDIEAVLTGSFVVVVAVSVISFLL